MTRSSERSILLLPDGEFCSTPQGFAPTADRIHEFIFGLRDHGYRVTLASRTRPAAPGDTLLDPLPPEERARFQPLPWYSGLSAAAMDSINPFSSTRRRLVELVRSHDIVIYRSNHARAALVGSLCKRFGRVSVPWWAGHPWAGIGGSRVSRRCKMAMARRRLRDMQQPFREATFNVILDPQMVEYLPPSARTLRLVPTLVRNDQIRDSPNRRRAGAPLRALYAGRLTEAKGVGVVLDMIERHALPDVVVWMAGCGPLADRIAAVARRHPSTLRHLGNLRSDAMADALRRAHVSILCSYSEGMPKILWESFAAGVPMIATPVGGVPIHVRPGDTGTLVPPGDPEGLAHAINTLASDEALRIRLGRHAIEEVREHTKEKQLALLAARLDTSLQSNRPRQRSR